MLWCLAWVWIFKTLNELILFLLDFSMQYYSLTILRWCTNYYSFRELPQLMMKSVKLENLMAAKWTWCSKIISRESFSSGPDRLQSEVERFSLSSWYPRLRKFLLKRVLKNWRKEITQAPWLRLHFGRQNESILNHCLNRWLFNLFKMEI